MAPDAASGEAARTRAGASDGPAGTWSRIARLGSAGRSAGVLVLATLTVLLLVWGPDARLRGLWFDFCQRVAPRVRISGPAVIVAVDEPSLARYGQWPWPRQLLAQLVDRVRAAGPAAVGLNLLFPEADGFSGASLASRLPGLAARTAAWVASVPDGDRALGEALAAAPSVIGLAGPRRGRPPRRRKATSRPRSFAARIRRGRSGATGRSSAACPTSTAARPVTPS